MKYLLGMLCLVALQPGAAYAQFDHQHKAWDNLLKKNVVVIDDGRAGRVRYAGFAQDRAALKSYLADLSGVSEAEFRSWNKARQMAFLVNAYNAYTVEKVLTRYPNLKSIRDFGAVFGNPWQDKFFKLLGHDSYLDQIEHEMLRAKGAYKDPRVHFALNCASVGCPMLREEAYVAERLDTQLEDQARRFLSDRSRNRYDEARQVLAVSKIFDWYGEDWTSGQMEFSKTGLPIVSREQFFAGYARSLADRPEQQALIAAQKAAIVFLDYDWSLNDAARQ